MRSVRGWTRDVWLAIAFVVAAGAVARADALPERTDRLIGLARVWAKVKFFHPYLAYKDLDWDAALVAAIPRVEAATRIEEYRAALQGMVAVLGDPVTRIEPAVPEPGPPDAAAAPDWLTTPAPGILLVRIAGLVAERADFPAIRARIGQVAAEAAKARVLVLDLRVPRPLAPYALGLASRLDAALPAITEWPSERVLEHRGYATQDGQTSGGYYSSFLTIGAKLATPGDSPGPSHVVVLVDPGGGVPSSALALQASGRATIVARGALGEDAAVAMTDVALPGGLRAQVRLGELLWGPPAADVVVARDQDLEPRGLAIAKAAAARTTPVARPHKQVALPAMRLRPDLDYVDSPYPSRERRMLAGIRLWAVLDSFYPYRYLIEDWDGALRDALPRLADAADLDGYRRALRELGARAGDGHINVYPAAPEMATRRTLTAVATRLVERKLVVVRLLDPAEADRQHLAVGDVIETIDGVPAAGAMAARRAETSASTDEARDQLLAYAALAGEDGTRVAIVVRGADGVLRDVTLTRTAVNLAAARAKSTAPHWSKLAGNIGYVDLRELVTPEVGPMFAALHDTRAIVFDMRGYPNGTAWPIAPRINTRGARYGAQFLKPLARGDAGDGEQRDVRERFLQPIPPLPGAAEVYRGKIVVLIDDRAISQAEHTCLFFAQAAGAVFVGSPTHGANGDVTVMRLPGGLRMSFTGQEVRHADGRQLQKVGIQPDVMVRPTIAGVRAGKDEVLDRALAYLATGK